MLVHKKMIMRISESYHKKIVTEYWAKAPATHGSMDESTFDFYAKELGKLIDLYCPTNGKTLLDHGAGRGEIAIRMASYCAAVYGGGGVFASELFEPYRQSLADKGLEVFNSEDLPKNKFDIILMNGAFYYIHLKNMKNEIDRLIRSLKDGGFLFLTDIPTVQKSHLLYGNHKGIRASLGKTVDKLTCVYQFELGGFFVNENMIKRCFPQTDVVDSWCYYRSHFIIKKE